MTIQQQFQVPPIRNAYSADLAKYGRDVVAYWFEMDHPFEGHRTLEEHFEIYLDRYQWRKILRPNTTIVDIGAHSGDTSIIMAAMSGGTVLAVECNPEIKVWLDFAAHMNRHLAKIVTASEAVTTENTVLTFADHGNGMCNGGLTGSAWSVGTQNSVPRGSSIQVQGLTLETMLSRYLTAEEIDNIDLIKTDTEGHDFEILRNSRELINRIRPKIFAEWFNFFDDEDIAKMFDVINELDYVALYPETFAFATPSVKSEDLLLIHRSQVDAFLAEAAQIK